MVILVALHLIYAYLEIFFNISIYYKYKSA